LCKSLSEFYCCTQQAVQTNICDVCNPSKASFDVIRLAVTVRCEAVTAVTEGWCPSEYRCDITADTFLQEAH
jgi:hypothetical protein